MQTPITDATAYIGRNAGSKLLYSIRNARRSVKIVSPYLSPSYIKELVKLHEKGVDITLITSDKLEENEKYGFTHQDVIKQETHIDTESAKLRKLSMTLSIILFIISTALIIITKNHTALWWITSIISLIALIISYNIRTKTYTYNPIFKLRVFQRETTEGSKGHFIHAKIFIIDNTEAYTGSTNYTHNGLVSNYETSIQIQDREAVKKINDEVEELYNNTALKYIDIQEWGKQLYKEPKN